ncbi:hypothetical protein PFICI_00052 [Pestalotiopsis fici W106-1]|uniref:Extracellular membrane protein CFEM domain-containing protein n=1 Tax=Pestalotiopsis fici (strain W106-1 / CGMCC3.15140) TaxID=1229662 RepID=W3XJP0_PESFW|nr:uncharacterized protein PFICI_00052 [Pestalotiopsis fici W106-1]ETS86224.1 hypothetical protein PFICI_00052 [Pestalotiopsis fici W106-1]
MKFTPVVLLLATLVAALPEPAPAPEALAEPEPVPEPKTAVSTLPILPPVDLPNPLSLLTVFGVCITGCIEKSIVIKTDCAKTPTAKCVCPSIKEVLIDSSTCFKTCKPNNLLVLAAVACKLKGIDI